MPIAEEAEVGVDNGSDDDPDEEALGVPPQFDSFVDEGPSTSKKVRSIMLDQCKIVLFTSRSFTCFYYFTFNCSNNTMISH